MAFVKSESIRRGNRHSESLSDFLRISDSTNVMVHKEKFFEEDNDTL